MSEKRFFYSYFTEHIIDKVTDKCYPVRYVEGVYELTDLLNEMSDENGQLKKKCDVLQKKTEMDKNDFFISEAKRMRLLAFIEDNGLRKEYYEWERRIWND